MRHLFIKTIVCLLCTFASVNVWATETSYLHDFTTKPSEGDNTLTTVVWTVSNVTNLNSYNSQNYAGVQIGTANNNGSITLTTNESWGASGTYEGKTVVKQVNLWLNNGSGTISAVVTIGGNTATGTGTVVQNKSAVDDYTQASKVVYTPAEGGNTGIIEIAVTTTKAGYLCAIEVICDEPSADSGTETEPATPSFTITDKTIEKGVTQVITGIATDNTDDYTISYTSSDETVASVADDKITANGVGTCTITASMTATTNFLATETSFTVTVVEATKKTPTLSSMSMNIGKSDFITLSTTATPEDASITYTITSGSDYLSFDGSTMQASAVGTSIVTASYAGNDTYNSWSQNFTVNVIEDGSFKESFNTNSFTGGNDGSWSGSIASGTLSSVNDGWTFTNGSGANQCAKLGTSSKLGSATTPALSFTGSVKLTFKAAAWAGDATTLLLSATSGTLSASSVTLKNSEWTTYEVDIMDVTESTQITFAANQASKNRFFLDEVSVIPVYTQLTSSESLKGWKTFYNADNSYAVDDNSSIYVAALGDGQVTLTKVDGQVIPKGEPVLVKTQSNDYNIILYPTATESTYTDWDNNAFAVTGESATGYVLAAKKPTGSDSKVLAFYKYKNLPSGMVYIPVPNESNSSMLRMTIEDETSTGIEAVGSADIPVSAFSLTGTKINTTRGLMIRNGKVVMLK